tara:strand:- start:1658 stop:2104 length:447 start_codon:yes stop_codon:yes gene_type:complete
MFDAEVKQMLVRHEGIRIFPYKCSENYLTISCGRNLETNGISEEEAMYLLDNDIKRVKEELNMNFGAWRTMPEKARMVCIDMTFQMGITGFMKFRKTRQLMEMGLWLESSEEILRSRYNLQTPSRCAENSRLLALCGQNGKDKRRASK